MEKKQLEELSKDELLQLVANMIRYGKLKLEDVEAITSNRPSKEELDLANSLHAVLCQDNHGPDGCYFYDEWNKAEPGKTITKWIELVSYLCTRLDVEAAELKRGLPAIARYQTWIEQETAIGRKLIELSVRNTDPMYPFEVDECISEMHLRS